MSICSIPRLRLNMMFLSLGVLALTLGFNTLLSVSTLDSLAAESILSGYRSATEHFARSVERGMRFGKPLDSYAGMGEMLKELQHGTEGISLVEIVDANGTVLYSQPDAPKGTQAFGTPQTRPSDLRLMTSSSPSSTNTFTKTPTGYRILVPLHFKGLAGWIALEVSREQVDAAAISFLHWSLLLALVGCAVVAAVLTGWLGLLTATQEARSSLHTSLGRLLLILIGGMQLAYSCGTLVLFDSFVEQALLTKTTIIAQSIERDFEYLIHKGVDVKRLRGKEQLLEQVVTGNPELKGAALLTPEGDVLASAGLTIADSSSSDPVVERPLDAYWASRFMPRQHIMLLRLVLDRQIITDRLYRLAVDLGTSLLISLLFLHELAKLLGLIVSRNFASVTDAPEKHSGSKLPHTTQALRAAGFVFFFGYDMGISFIPLLARTLYKPFWGLSEKIIIGLPISAEMVSAGIALLISGTISQRHGWYKTYLVGVACAASGMGLGGLATDLSLLIVSRLMTGFGFGLILMASQLGTLEHSNAGAGLANVFAGIFSGSICGSAAGAMLAEHISFKFALMVGAVVIVFAARAVLFGRTKDTSLRDPNSRAVAETTAISGMARLTGALPFSGSMALVKDPRMHLILFLIGIPAAICLTGFLLYLLPLLLDAAHMEQADIGRIFMLYGLCFITAGPVLGKWIDRTDDKSFFLMMTGLLSGAALLLATTAIGIFGNALAVIALGLAQCIAAPTTMLCILALGSAQRLGKEKTASIYRSMERVGQVVGPLLFGAALVVMETRQALLFMGGGVCLLAIFFMLIWRLNTSKS